MVQLIQILSIEFTLLARQLLILPFATMTTPSQCNYEIEARKCLFHYR